MKLSATPDSTAPPGCPDGSRRRQRSGFTLIELMVAVSVVGILAAIAMPSYTRYLVRSRSLAALTTLSSTAASLEQRFQDVGSYGSGTCGVAMAPSTQDFAYSCAVGTPVNPAGFVVTATGSGMVAGITYTIDDAGVHRTLAHPYGLPASDCWTIRGSTCDS